MNKAYYAKRGLFIGITALFCAFYFFGPTLFTFKSSLVEQNGEIEYLKVIYTRVESSRGAKSIKSELKFTLNSTQSVYVLMKNTGQSRYNERFEKLERQLNNSGRVTVWVKKSQKEEYKPTVFQIADRNGTILYDFNESKSLSRVGFLVSGYFGVMVPPVSVKQCHFERSFNNTKNVLIVF